jgi:hypothetical protein
MTGRRYSGFTNATNTQSSTAPLFNLVGATTTRVRVYDFISGSDATPADNAAKFAFQRTTVNFGTPVAVTPVALDPADPASLCLFSTPGGTAPTITANSTLLQVAHNQRATFRWVAAPDSELVIPATAAAGICLTPLVATAAVNYAFTLLWAE